MSKRNSNRRMNEDLCRLGEQINAISLHYEPDKNVKTATRFRLLQKIAKEQENVTSMPNLRFNKQVSDQPRRRFAMSWMFIAVTLMALAGGTGAVYASNDALPGDILYPVKIASEDVQLFFSDDENDADLLLSFMDKRLEEMDTLVEEGDEEALDLALNTYQNQLEQLTNLMSQRQPEDPIAGDALAAQVQSRLEEQAQRMLNINEEVGERLQMQLQTQDRIETQDQLQLKDGVGSQGQGVEDITNAETVPSDNQQDGSQSGEPQNQNQSKMSASLQTYNLSADDRISLRFVISGQPSGNIYVRVNGVQYACSHSNGSINCEGPAPVNEDALIEVVDAGSGTLLYSQRITIPAAQGSDSSNGSGGGQGEGGSGGKQH